VLSGRGLCDELITRPEESYQLWCIIVCDLEKQTSLMRRPRPTTGLSRQEKKNIRTNTTKLFEIKHFIMRHQIGYAILKRNMEKQ
jgi:hypothetical protein